MTYIFIWDHCGLPKVAPTRIEEDSEQSRENEQTHSLPNDARRGNMRPREEEWGDKNAWTPSGCYKTRRSTRRRGSPDSDPLILPADWSDSEEKERKEREGRRSSSRRSSCPQSARLLSTQRDWRQIRSAEIIKRSHVTGAHSWRFHFSSCARALIAHHYLLSSHRDSFSALACGFG